MFQACSKIFTCIISFAPQKDCEARAIIVLIFQMWKLRHREVQELVQCHPAELAFEHRGAGFRASLT